jgi:predicted MFS family arabinose efflux permease
LVGVGSAAYWTFAVDDLQHAGGLPTAASSAFLGVVGVASILSTATGDLVARFGARPVFVTAITLEGASVALLATAPSSLTAALTSAVVFGASYNAVIAIEALWSLHLYPQQPSLGLAIAMAAIAIGQLCGPLASGTLANSIGLTNVLFVGAGIIALASLAAPRTPIDIVGSPGRLIPPSPAQDPAADSAC